MGDPGLALGDQVNSSIASGGNAIAPAPAVPEAVTDGLHQAMHACLDWQLAGGWRPIILRADGEARQAMEVCKGLLYPTQSSFETIGQIASFAAAVGVVLAVGWGLIWAIGAAGSALWRSTRRG